MPPERAQDYLATQVISESARGELFVYALGKVSQRTSSLGSQTEMSTEDRQCQIPEEPATAPDLLRELERLFAKCPSVANPLRTLISYGVEQDIGDGENLATLLRNCVSSLEDQRKAKERVGEIKMVNAAEFESKGSPRLAVAEKKSISTSRGNEASSAASLDDSINRSRTSSVPLTPPLVAEVDHGNLVRPTLLNKEFVTQVREELNRLLSTSTQSGSAEDAFFSVTWLNSVAGHVSQMIDCHLKSKMEDGTRTPETSAAASGRARMKTWSMTPSILDAASPDRSASPGANSGELPVKEKLRQTILSF